MFGDAETGGEGDVLGVGQVLIPEEDDQVAHQRLVDLLEGGVRQGLGQVDPVHPGADLRRHWRHFNRPVCGH